MGERRVQTRVVALAVASKVWDCAVTLVGSVTCVVVGVIFGGCWWLLVVVGGWWCGC